MVTSFRACYVPVGRYCVPVGRYCVPVGRYCVPVGRYCVPVGRCCVLVGRCCVPVGHYCAPSSLSECFLSSFWCISRPVYTFLLFVEFVCVFSIKDSTYLSNFSLVHLPEVLFYSFRALFFLLSIQNLYSVLLTVHGPLLLNLLILP
jgi:hypothetical protein